MASEISLRRKMLLESLWASAHMDGKLEIPEELQDDWGHQLIERYLVDIIWNMNVADDQTGADMVRNMLLSQLNHLSS
jgi:hypothetical protein